jgi:uncharacterized protein involved in response to NO
LSPIPRYRPQSGPYLLSADFRPFFLLSALWVPLAMPLWLAVYTGESELPAKHA